MNDIRVGEILSRYGLSTAKSLGQNFLCDSSVLEQIAQAARPAERILEIGAGIGTLTDLLCRNADRVTTVEIDRSLEPLLREQVPHRNHTFEWVDVLKFDFTALTAPHVIVGNLPYYITSDILMLLLKHIDRWEKAILMVQREVADRLLAGPGSKEYRAASVLVQSFCRGETLFEVPPHCFYPPPHVHSAVMKLVPKQDRPDPESYVKFVNACFAARRKMLCSAPAVLQLLHSDKNRMISLLSQAGLPQNVRAEALTPDEFLRLYQLCTNY